MAEKVLEFARGMLLADQNAEIILENSKEEMIASVCLSHT
jgi:hypothetical protein